MVVGCVGIAAGLAMEGGVGIMMASAGSASLFVGLYCYIR
jgi:hypothetical protein